MEQQENEILLALRGVSKAFKEPRDSLFRKRPRKQALLEIDLAVPRNRVSCLLGPNGAGKTTLIKILASLIIPDSGEILYDGIPRERWGKSIQGKIGLVTPNERSFYWRLTGRQNLMFFGSLYSLAGKALKARVELALSETDMLEAAGKPYRLYSTGMKQKLNIARALIGEPELFLLDEPASHLDPLAREDFWNFVAKTLIAKRGATVFLCTHDLEEARRLADLTIILDQGRVIEKVTPAELHGLVVGRAELELRYSGPVPEEWLRRHRDAVSEQKQGYLRINLDATGLSQEGLIRSFVLEGGALLQASRSQDELLALLNRSIRHDA
jgi:ABC-2 type transport system ATP-binding protein